MPFIGRTCRGFDFLGYQFTPTGLGVAQKTLARLAERRTRLYEQGALPERIGSYVRQWRQWVTGGLGRHHVTVDLESWAAVRAPMRAPTTLKR